MPNTFSQIYIHVVFSVHERIQLIESSWEDILFKYISGIIKNKGQKLLAINGTADHIHFFIGLMPDCSLSDLVREIKKASNVFIREKKLSKTTFAWQEGYGAFSYSHSQIDSVIKYIMNQKEHHKKETFLDEYKNFLEKFNISYKNEYL